LNDINNNGWANNEIIRIIREQNTDIAWILNPERLHIVDHIPKNFIRQSITARGGVIPWDLCTVPAKTNRKGH
jgi:hypothetical protein